MAGLAASGPSGLSSILTTGTLTTGQSQVQEFIIDGETPRQQILQWAEAVSSASTHGLAVAICRFADSDAALPQLSELETRSGRGVIDTLLEERRGNAHDHRTVDLALGGFAVDD